VILPCKHSQPSLLFTGTAGSQSSEAPYYDAIMLAVSATNIRLAGKCFKKTNEKLLCNTFKTKYDMFFVTDHSGQCYKHFFV